MPVASIDACFLSPPALPHDISTERIFRAVSSWRSSSASRWARATRSGLFLQPVSADMKWAASFLVRGGAAKPGLGASQPFIGYIADRYGARRALIAGAVLYALAGWTAFLSNTFTLAISAAS